tara:strand:- start:342 stop:521 length:180 start_codon:yes stop_codon:yes gene_type:complete
LAGSSVAKNTEKASNASGDLTGGNTAKKTNVLGKKKVMSKQFMTKKEREAFEAQRKIEL